MHWGVLAEICFSPFMAIEARRDSLDKKRVVNQGLNCNFHETFVGISDDKRPNSERLGLLFVGLNAAVFYEKASKSVEVFVPDTVGNALGEVGTDADSHWHLTILSWSQGLCIRQRKV
jgi:hypothetical protein